MGSHAPGQPSNCAQCHTSIEEASLLLVCQHNLCLHCAAQSLSGVRGPGASGQFVRCCTCQSVTKVEDDAATYLEKLRGTADGGNSFTSSGQGTTQETVSPCVPKVIFEHVTDPTLGVLPTQKHRQPYPAAGHTATSFSGSSAAAPVRSVRVLHAATAEPPKVQAPRPVRFCGQCEERPADLVCEQCDEFFCRSCAATIHRRGQMAKHNLRLHLGKDSDAAASSSLGNAKSPRAANVTASPRMATLSPRQPTNGLVPVPVTVEAINMAPSMQKPFNPPVPKCSKHPEESLQYFCLTCECECLCAECVIHGDHQGHEVLLIREAAKKLPSWSADLLNSARLREEELTAMAEVVSKELQHMNAYVDSSRQNLRAQIEQVNAGLESEEKVLMSEVQRCSSEVVDILAQPEQSVEDHIKELSLALRRCHSTGEAISSLNAFVRLSTAMKAPLSLNDHGIGIGDLKAQLQRGFESRLASIANLANQINQIGQAPVRGGSDTRIVSSAPVSPQQAAALQELARSPTDSNSNFAGTFRSLATKDASSPTLLSTSATAGKIGQAYAPARFGTLYSPSEEQFEH